MRHCGAKTTLPFVAVQTRDAKSRVQGIRGDAALSESLRPLQLLPAHQFAQLPVVDAQDFRRDNQLAKLAPTFSLHPAKPAAT